MNYTRLEPIPAHFFEKGKYEVWAIIPVGCSAWNEKLQLVADGLTLETARAYQWRGKEIRINGKVVQ